MLFFYMLTICISLIFSFLRSKPSFQCRILIPTTFTEVVLDVFGFSFRDINTVAVVPLFTGITCSERFAVQSGKTKLNLTKLLEYATST